MDLKRLRTFVAVADLGTVSKAALRLRISQSALSRQISDLEYECEICVAVIPPPAVTAGASSLGRPPRLQRSSCAP